MDIKSSWEFANKLPMVGPALFSRALGWMIPYTGSIKPKVEELHPGYARISMADKRGIRNHLDSIHALALSNLGELTTGMVVASKVRPSQRFVLRSLKIDFLKKARGKITAQAKLDHKQDLQEDQEVLAELFDAGGVKVCEVLAVWRVGEKQKPKV